MGIRERLNEFPRATIGILGAAVALAVLLAVLIGRPSPDASGGSVLARAFYTTDDGQTWFTDDRAKVYPFDHNGKPAYRAYVFRCGESGKPFAAYLERFTDAALKAAHSGSAGTSPRGALEVKRPGDAEWVGPETAKGTQVMTPKCPAGQMGTPDPVMP